VSGARPNPPRFVRVWETQRPHRLHIAWQPPTYSPVSLRYIIEYKTVGQWVPLVELPDDENEYTWTTASGGTLYRFRVCSISSAGGRSEPTRVVSIFTTSTSTASLFFCRLSLKPLDSVEVKA